MTVRSLTFTLCALLGVPNAVANEDDPALWSEECLTVRWAEWKTDPNDVVRPSFLLDDRWSEWLGGTDPQTYQDADFIARATVRGSAWHPTPQPTGDLRELKRWTGPARSVRWARPASSAERKALAADQAGLPAGLWREPMGQTRIRNRDGDVAFVEVWEDGVLRLIAVRGEETALVSRCDLPNFPEVAGAAETAPIIFVPRERGVFASAYLDPFSMRAGLENLRAHGGRVEIMQRHSGVAVDARKDRPEDFERRRADFRLRLSERIQRAAPEGAHLLCEGAGALDCLIVARANAGDVKSVMLHGPLMWLESHEATRIPLDEWPERDSRLVQGSQLFFDSLEGFPMGWTPRLMVADIHNAPLPPSGFGAKVRILGLADLGDGWNVPILAGVAALAGVDEPFTDIDAPKGYEFRNRAHADAVIGRIAEALAH